jgi:hypothetical protein
MVIGTSNVLEFKVCIGILMLGIPVYSPTGTSPYLPKDEASGEGGVIVTNPGED